MVHVAMGLKAMPCFILSGGVTTNSKLQGVNRGDIPCADDRDTGGTQRVDEIAGNARKTIVREWSGTAVLATGSLLMGEALVVFVLYLPLLGNVTASRLTSDGEANVMA